MKKTFIYIMAAVAATAVVSCQKIYNDEAPAGLTLTASFDYTTKTDLGEHVTWATDDKILVMDEAGNSDSFTLSDGAGTTNGTFTQDNSVSLSGQLYAVYGDPNASFSNGKIHFTIPEQDGSFAKANICVAKANDLTLTFQNATAIVKVVDPNVAPATRPGGGEQKSYVNYFSCTAAENCFYTGVMTADFSTTPVTISAPTTAGTAAYIWGTRREVKDYGSKLTLDVLKDVFYFAVAPGNTYSFIAESYKLDNSGKKVQEVKAYPPVGDGPGASVVPLTKTLERNKIYTVTPSFK